MAYMLNRSAKQACTCRRASSLRVITVSVLAALTCMAAHAGELAFRDKLISIGSSSRSGTTHQVGSALCNAVNRERKTSLIRCVPYSTVGSQYNAKAVAYGELTMGFTLSHIAFDEFSQRNAEKRDGNLRAVMSLYALPLLVIARRDANITDATQLAGHSINLSNRGSGQRSITEMLLKSLGLSAADFSKVTELNAARMGEAFCKGEIDVILESYGNPSPFYKKMIEECKGVIVTFSPQMIDKIITANPLMTRLTVAGGLYAGHPQPVQTVGYQSLLVTREEVSDEAVYRFVASVMSGLGELKRSIPELRELDPGKMFSEGITIPLHQGVVNYLNSKKTTSNRVASTIL